MKKQYLVIILLLLIPFFRLSFGAEKTPYQRMCVLFKRGITDEAFNSFFTSLSKEDFKKLLDEYFELAPEATEGGFAFMSVLSVPYYKQGAGKDDGFKEWERDLKDRNFPMEWRSIILGHPPVKARQELQQQKDNYFKLLAAFFFDEKESLRIRIQSMGYMPKALPYGDWPIDIFQQYISTLISLIEDPNQKHWCIAQVLRAMDNVVAYGANHTKSKEDVKLIRAFHDIDQQLFKENIILSKQERAFLLPIVQLNLNYSQYLNEFLKSTNLNTEATAILLKEWQQKRQKELRKLLSTFDDSSSEVPHATDLEALHEKTINTNNVRNPENLKPEEKPKLKSESDFNPEIEKLMTAKESEDRSSFFSYTIIAGVIVVLSLLAWIFIRKQK